MDIKKILASADPKAIEELKEIVNEKDDAKLTQYLDKFLRNFEQRPRKVSTTASIKVKNREGKVLAFYNLSDFEWIRFKGKKSKVLPYPDAIVKVLPDTVLGMSKTCDLKGNYQIIIPSYKKFPLSIAKAVAVALRNRSKPYTGDVTLLFHSSK